MFDIDKPSREKILIVEDERMVALDIAKSLKKAGYDIIGSVSTGNSAVQKVKEFNPDLILMDIRIKGEYDGIEAAKKILTDNDIPIVYLTAYTDDNTIERAKSTAPYGYILKPFDERRLFSTIDMALYKHKLEQKVKESERWLSAILRNMGEALIAVDPEGKIIFMNTVSEQLTCFTREESLGKNINKIFHIYNSETKERIENFLHSTIKSGGIISYKNNIVLVDKNGNRKPVIATVSPVKNEEEIITNIIIVFQDITEIKNAQKEQEKLYKKVIEAQERLKILSRRLIDIQESERGKISRELHDEIGQALTAIKIGLQSVRRTKDITKLESIINENVELVELAIEQVRNLSLDLRPSMLDDLGLIPALRSFINRQALRAGINVDFKSEPVNQKLSAGLETTVYRVTQEAVTNIFKHSKAKNIKVEIWQQKNLLYLKINDDGSGFDVETARENAVLGRSIGILGMQERVELIGGSFQLTSSLFKGTEIFAVFPID